MEPWIIKKIYILGFGVEKGDEVNYFEEANHNRLVDSEHDTRKFMKNWGFLGIRQLQLGRISGLAGYSGRILDVEIIRLYIGSYRIFSLTLLKLSGWISDNFIFYRKQYLNSLVGYPVR